MGTSQVVSGQLSKAWCSTLFKPMYLQGGWDPSEWHLQHAAGILEEVIVMDCSILCENNPKKEALAIHELALAVCSARGRRKKSK